MESINRMWIIVLNVAVNLLSIYTLPMLDNRWQMISTNLFLQVYDEQDSE